MVRLDFLVFGYRVLHCESSAERTQMMANLMRSGISATTHSECDILIRERDYLQNADYISRQNCIIDDKPHGLLPALKSALKQRVSLFALLVVIALNLLAPTVVWDVRVSGCETIPESYLSGPAHNWEQFLLADVQRITDGTWTGTNQWHGMAEGLVDLCEMKNLADGTEEKVAEAMEGFKNGTLDIWAGELKDNAGNVVVAEGATMSDAELLSMMWLIEGVNGSAN